MKPDRQVVGILIALAVAVAAYLISLLALSETHARLVGVVLFLVVLWTNEALPLGVVSLFPIVLFPALGFLNTAQTAANYANGIIFLFLGGFMMAIAVEKTGLHKIIARRLLRIFPATPKGAIYALAITAGLLSAVLSNTTTALLLLPLAHFLAADISLKMRLALAIAFGSGVGGIMTPIGTPPNLILLGFLQSHAIEAPSFVGWIILTAPLAVLMLLMLSWVLSLGTAKLALGYQLSDFTPMSREQKKLGLTLLALALLLLLNSPLKPWYGGLGLDERSLILGFGLLVFLPGFKFLEWADSKQIPFEIIFLFGAGFALAMAFQSTGFDTTVAGAMSVLTGLHPSVAMVAIVLMMMAAGLVVSNTALASMALPIVYSLAQQGHLDVELFLMVATISASFAFVLPISTPPNAIALSSGAVRVGQMAAYGTLFSLLGALLLVLVATLYWQWVL